MERIYQEYSRIDENIGIRHSQLNLVFRQADNAVWLCGFLPTAIALGSIYYPTCSDEYKTVAIVGISQLLQCICDWYDKNPSLFRITLLIPCAVNVFFSMLSGNQSALSSLLIGSSAPPFYSYTFRKLLQHCPRCFTYGEATLLTQSVVLYLTSFLMASVTVAGDSCARISTYTTQAGIFSILILVLIAFKFSKWMNQIIIFLIVAVSSVSAFAIVLPILVLRINPLLWLYNLLSDLSSIALILYWSICSALAVYEIVKQCRNESSQITNKKERPIVRKSFHFLAFAVFLPGLIVNPCLMYIASGVGLALLIVTETCRKLKISLFADSLEAGFNAFKDEKDEGELALTPIYLMVGCAVPLWIFPIEYDNKVPLPVLSGLLSIAIGDAIAGIFGTKFGKHYWTGSQKTVEGSIFCFLSQVFVYLAINASGIVYVKNEIWPIFVFVAVTLIEANIDQIDNVVLPLATYILLLLF